MMDKKKIFLLGVVMSIIGISSFFILTIHSKWLDRSVILQYVNLIAWLIGLSGVFTMVISGLLLFSEK